jgi:hypothetical protein
MFKPTALLSQRGMSKWRTIGKDKISNQRFGFAA